MEIPPEVLAARELLEGPLLATGVITGIDFGVRDEEQPDPDDLALRVFVADLDDVPFEVQVALAGFPFPVVFLQRVFVFTQTTLPDTGIHRPLRGGYSIAAARFQLTDADVHTGTLGAIVTDTLDPTITYGLSNYHVLCYDLGRRVGDEIIQPEPEPFGRVQGDHAGTLSDWSFPEDTPEGPADAAIFRVDVGALPEIEGIGPVGGAIGVQHAMLVTKRGKTTGRTFGWTSGVRGSYPINRPQLPPVGTPPSTRRKLTDQIQIHVDFPHSIVWSESGDSGSVVIGDGNGVVGLHWASGFDPEEPGNPMRYGLATPAITVERVLGISFGAP
ncbi:hypothetical protein ACH35V_39905 [Actinomadura sp. 1N219]|uniref:hypothetical protein n=1 Tax=Actinomadura sp. 1N219 TaxID=3375152 RepID=UPI00378FCB0B